MLEKVTSQICKLSEFCDMFFFQMLIAWILGDIGAQI